MSFVRRIRRLYRESAKNVNIDRRIKPTIDKLNPRLIVRSIGRQGSRNHLLRHVRYEKYEKNRICKKNVYIVYN